MKAKRREKKRVIAPGIIIEKMAAEGKAANLQNLLKKGQTWTVTEGGPEL